MGKLLYNGIMKRWLYGADIDENINRKSAIFKEGYDDPTYMTFRIEFGDWGASVLDRSIIQTGTTVFRPTFNDYDALPIGLLNCPAPGNSDNAYWQSDSPEDYTNFNNISIILVKINNIIQVIISTTLIAIVSATVSVAFSFASSAAP